MDIDFIFKIWKGWRKVFSDRNILVRFLEVGNMVVAESGECCTWPKKPGECCTWSKDAGQAMEPLMCWDTHTLHTFLPCTAINNGGEWQCYNLVCMQLPFVYFNPITISTVTILFDQFLYKWIFCNAFSTGESFVLLVPFLHLILKRMMQGEPHTTKMGR